MPESPPPARTHDRTPGGKRRRHSASADGVKPLETPTSSREGVRSRHPSRSGSTDMPPEGPEAASDSEVKSRTASASPSHEWSYTLEVIQQPQRARACGFGDKDRRPITPPLIVRLWILTASGEPVDLTNVNIQFLIILVDLWSGDGSQQRNIVMHQSSRPDTDSSETLASSTSRPDTSWASPPSTRQFAYSVSRSSDGWRFPAFAEPEENQYPPAGLDRNQRPGGPAFRPSSRSREGPAESSRPPIANRDEASGQPAPSIRTSPDRNAIQPFRLPPISEISSHAVFNREPKVDLPSFPDPSRSARTDPSHSQQQTESFGQLRTDSPRSAGPSGERSSSRNPSSNVPVEPRIIHSSWYPPFEPEKGFPLTPEETNRLSTSDMSSFSRVLVGSLTATCQRLKDEDGKIGLFFFCPDLGIRSEGVFSLRFTLVNLESLMLQTVSPEASKRTLAEIYSDPFTVYSAKRFPGVIPTTNLTRFFAGQNVRLPTRMRRTKDDESEDE